MKVVWGIASYQRPDRQPWLTQLHEWGYAKEDIYLSTQTEEDYAEYSRRWGEWATVLYRPGTCVSDNKNTILEEVQGRPESVIMCSDKVRGFLRLSGDGKKTEAVKSREEMDRIVEYMVGTMERLGGETAGVYSVGNAHYMSRSIHVNQQILGCFQIFRPGTEWRFAPYARLKEDFEICMQIISAGGRVIRFNQFALKETLHTTGGCHAEWNAKGDSVNAECTRQILERYPTLLRPHPTRKNEVKYIGPRKKINLK